jgi:phosphohistidine phosphatase
MELYILRHAIAADLGQMGARTDDERPLTDEGRRRMQLACQGMARLGLRFDQIVSSPLVRTRQTAELVVAQFDTPLALADELAPGATLRDLRAALRPYESKRRLLVVGHEPDCSTNTAALIGGGNVEFKKGALARIDTPQIEAKAGLLIWLLAPAVLRALGSAEADEQGGD